MNLEQIINEQIELTSKINTALDKLIEWFESKMDKAEEILYKCKDMIEDKLRSIKKNESAYLLENDTDEIYEVISICKEALVLMKREYLKLSEICKYVIHELTNLKKRQQDRKEISDAINKIGGLKIKVNGVYAGMKEKQKVIEVALSAKRLGGYYTTVKAKQDLNKLKNKTFGK